MESNLIGLLNPRGLDLKQALQVYQDIQLDTFFFYLTRADAALLLAESNEIRMAIEVFSLVCQQG